MKRISFFLVLLIQLASCYLHAKTYFIDPENGNDVENNGLSTENAWKSFRNLFSYRGDRRPDYAILLEAGDTIFVLDGIISNYYRPGDDEGDANVTGRPAIMRFRGVYGTKNQPVCLLAYPGHHPVLDANYKSECIYIEQASWIEISGLTLREGYSQGEGGNIAIKGVAENILLKNCEIYDASGTDNGNVSGLNCSGGTNIEIANCVFHDNYDRDAEDTDGISTANSTNMVFFSCSGFIKVHDCLIYQTPEPISTVNSGAGIKYKHSTPSANSTFEVYNNIFRNCKFMSFSSGSANTHFHHNIIIGGNIPVKSNDNGGPTHQNNQVFEYNTIYNTYSSENSTVSTPGFFYYPTTSWINDIFQDDPKNIVFRNNIIFHSGTYNFENNTITMYPYISNDLYNAAIPELYIDSNCYYNSIGENITFGLAASDKYGDLGDIYNWNEWKELTWINPENNHVTDLNYDIHSFNIDPNFITIDPELVKYDTSSTAFKPANTNVLNMGAYAGYETTSFFTSVDPSPNSSSNLNLIVKPNPFNEDLFISCSPLKNESFQLTITDILGRIVYSVKDVSDSETYKLKLQPSDHLLSKGIYVLSFCSGYYQESIILLHQ